MKLRILIAAASVAVGSVVATGTIFGASDDSGPSAKRGQSKYGQWDMSLQATREFRAFPLYFLGTSFEGLTLTHVDRVSGASAPQEPIRPNFVSFLYGDCEPTGEERSCAPPLEVQVWPACLRNPSVYELYPGLPLPREELMIRGVPAAFYSPGGDRLELSIGNVTVVIYGSRERARRAADALRGINNSVRASASLPTPLPGATVGKLRCTPETS